MPTGQLCQSYESLLRVSCEIDVHHKSEIQLRKACQYICDDGSISRGSGVVTIGDCPNSHNDIRLAGDDQKERIYPKEVLMVANMAVFYSNGTYTGRMTFHVG
ncbi:hypothetical protein OCU04_004053 [Sclerotinia nivalis]|uniref:Uncharacterized protein n=1 Tax=Sclerotinia nivalis TaxID=352851 RepID=A0A9X0AWM1_9HELO|nr:hypothetical protein OCU04_004053 [Sclerotinia nivalis]